MRHYLSVSVLYSMICALLFGATTHVHSSDERVSVKIGVEQRFSNNDNKWLESSESLKANDNIRIYIEPEEDCFAYIVQFSGKSGAPVLNEKRLLKNVPEYLPNSSQFWRIDGMNTKESFTIICSKNRLENIQEILNNKTINYNKWIKIEEDLLKSRISLSKDRSNQETLPQKILIGGQVRSMLPALRSGEKRVNIEGDKISIDIDIKPNDDWFRSQCDKNGIAKYEPKILPLGVDLDPNTGLISGEIQRKKIEFGEEKNDVVINIYDSTGSKLCIIYSFEWKVLPKPPIFSGNSWVIKKYEFEVEK